MPEVTPRGNPKNPSTAGNAGIVVATPALAPTGAQQWMCAALVFEVKSLNVALTCSVWATGSSTIVARPVPGDATGRGLRATANVGLGGSASPSPPAEKATARQDQSEKKS